MKLERIERKYNPETNNSFMTGDITAQTIEKLIEEGLRRCRISINFLVRTHF